MADIARYLSYTDIAYREDDEDLFGSLGVKHVRIAPQDEVTLTYKPKCFSMPDLLQVDTFRDTNHKHPKIQLGTHQHLGPVDMRGRINVSLYDDPFLGFLDKSYWENFIRCCLLILNFLASFSNFTQTRAYFLFIGIS